MKTNIFVLLLMAITLNIFAQRDNITYNELDEIPHYKGGEEAFEIFLAQNLHYPFLALNNDIDGNAVISFNIYPDGSIGNIQYKNYVDIILNKEAERLIKLTNGNWVAGKKNGEYVKSYYEKVINFSILNAKETLFYANKADKLYSKGKYEKSIPHIERVLSRSPYNFSYLLKLANSHYNIGNIEEACKIYERIKFLKFEQLDSEIEEKCK